jgi:hypothetical protein
MAKETNITFCLMRSNNNSINFFIIYMTSEQLQGQPHKQQSVHTGNYITNDQTHTDDNKISSSGKTVISALHNKEMHKDNANKKHNNVVLRTQGTVTAKHD